jgi:hypothetical protein
MRVNITARQIAGGLPDSFEIFLKQTPRVTMPESIQHNRQAAFERHVEPGHRWSANIHLNAGEIMKGETAAADQVDDASQPSTAARHF